LNDFLERSCVQQRALLFVLFLLFLLFLSMILHSRHGNTE